MPKVTTDIPLYRSVLKVGFKSLNVSGKTLTAFSNKIWSGKIDSCKSGSSLAPGEWSDCASSAPKCFCLQSKAFDVVQVIQFMFQSVESSGFMSS